MTTRGTSAGVVDGVVPTTVNRPVRLNVNPQCTFQLPGPSGAVRGTRSDQESRPLRAFFGTPCWVVPFEYWTNATQIGPALGVVTWMWSALPRSTDGAVAAGAAEAVAAQSARPATARAMRRRCGTGFPPIDSRDRPPPVGYDPHRGPSGAETLPPF